MARIPISLDAPVRQFPTRNLTQDVYMEEHNTLADRTLTKIGEFIGAGDLEGAAALLLAYQRKRDALWQERLATAARVVRP